MTKQKKCILFEERVTVRHHRWITARHEPTLCHAERMRQTTCGSVGISDVSDRHGQVFSVVDPSDSCSS